MNQASAQADWTANGNPELLRPTSDYLITVEFAMRETMSSAALSKTFDLSLQTTLCNHMLRSNRVKQILC